MLPRNNVQDPQDSRTFCLYADPRHLHARISALNGGDLSLDLREDIVCTHFLGLGRFVGEQEVKNRILASLKQIGGTVIQEVQCYMGLITSEGQEDVNSCSLGDIRHGDDLYLAEGSHKMHTACDRFLLTRLSRGLDLQVQGVLHPSGLVQAPVTVHQAWSAQLYERVVFFIELFNSNLDDVSHVIAISTTELAFRGAVYAGEKVVFSKVVPTQYLKAAFGFKGRCDADRP